MSFETLLDLADQAHQDYLRCANPDGSPNEVALKDFAYAHGHMFENLGRAVRELLLRQERMAEGWQKRLTVAEGWCRSLQEASSKANKAREAAESQIAELQTKLSELIKVQGSHAPNLGDFASATPVATGENLRALQSRLTELQDRCVELQDACDRQSEALGSTAERELALQELLENAQKEAALKYRERMIELEDAAKKDRLGRVEAERQLAQALSEAGVHQAEVLALREKFEVQEGTSLETFFTMTLQAVLALQEAHKNLEVELAAQQQALAASAESSRALQDQLNEAQAYGAQRLAAWTAERETMLKRAEDASTLVAQLRKDLEAAQAEGSSRQTELAVFTQQVEEGAARVVGLQQEVLQAQDEIQRLNAEAVTTLTTLSGLENKIRQHPIELEQLRQQFTVARGELEQTLTARDARLQELEQTVVERDTHLRGMADSLASREGQLQGLEQSLTERTAQLIELEHARSALALTLQTTETNAAEQAKLFAVEKEQLQAARTEALTAQQAQLEEASRQIEELWAKLDAEKKEAAEGVKKLESAEESRKQLRANKTELEFKARAAEESASKAKEHLSRVEARAENERVLWIEERAQLQGRANELEKDTARLLDEVAKATSLAQEMDRAAEEFRKVREDRDRLSGQIQELEETLAIERLTCPEGSECPVCSHKEWRSLQREVDKYQGIFSKLGALLGTAAESSGFVVDKELAHQVRSLIKGVPSCESCQGLVGLGASPGQIEEDI